MITSILFASLLNSTAEARPLKGMPHPGYQASVQEDPTEEFSKRIEKLTSQLALVTEDGLFAEELLLELLSEQECEIAGILYGRTVRIPGEDTQIWKAFGFELGSEGWNVSVDSRGTVRSDPWLDYQKLQGSLMLAGQSENIIQAILEPAEQQESDSAMTISTFYGNWMSSDQEVSEASGEIFGIMMPKSDYMLGGWSVCTD